MNRHLVAVEVGVKSRTYQRMELDRLSFYQDRLKGLDSQTVQRRSTVQHNGMLFNYILQHVPDLGLQALHHLFRVFNVMGGSVGYQFLHNKGLEQLDGHFLGKTALIDL